ncbi:MAG: DUF2946 family protein [Burkholderiales bacterium]|nr:DUF2946 family protein [Burkholderiales bacterium]
MDEIVARAMQKWPNVPNVFGWMRLDRRGAWLVKSRQPREDAPVFERISNAAVIEFIGRNYQADERGRWFFQNGPQRVFVTLESAPYVYRLCADGTSVEAHTGAAAGALRGAWLDESGQLLLETELGIGVLADRDLPAAAERMSDAAGAPLGEAGFAALMSGVGDAPAAFLELAGARVRIGRLATSDLAQRFGFDPAPRPAPGEPEC